MLKGAQKAAVQPPTATAGEESLKRRIEEAGLSIPIDTFRWRGPGEYVWSDGTRIVAKPGEAPEECKEAIREKIVRPVKAGYKELPRDLHLVSFRSSEEMNEGVKRLYASPEMSDARTEAIFEMRDWLAGEHMAGATADWQGSGAYRITVDAVSPSGAAASWEQEEQCLDEGELARSVIEAEAKAYDLLLTEEMERDPILYEALDGNDTETEQELLNLAYDIMDRYAGWDEIDFERLVEPLLLDEAEGTASEYGDEDDCGEDRRKEEVEGEGSAEDMSADENGGTPEG